MMEADKSKHQIEPNTPQSPKAKYRKKNHLQKASDIRFCSLQVACKICGDRSSGFHYGVHACEGCKGFFRRTVRLKLDYEECKLACKINAKNRNKCQYCRFKKCTELGMSHDAIRYGRMPKEEKEQIISDAANSFTHATNKTKLTSQNTKLFELANVLSSSFSAHFSATSARVDSSWEARINSTCTPKSLKTLADLPVVFPTIFEEIKNSIGTKSSESTSGQPTYDINANEPDTVEVVEDNEIPSNSCSTQTNWLDHNSIIVFLINKLQKRVLIGISKLTEYAKEIPGFIDLPLSDQVILLKYGSLEGLFVLVSNLLKDEGLYFPLLDVHVSFKFMEKLGTAYILMVPKIEFAKKIKRMNLNDTEMALFVALIILSTDRPGLTNLKKVEKMQEDVLSCLKFELSQSPHHNPMTFPNLLLLLPDLRRLIAEHVKMVDNWEDLHYEPPVTFL